NLFRRRKRWANSKFTRNLIQPLIFLAQGCHQLTNHLILLFGNNNTQFIPFNYTKITKPEGIVNLKVSLIIVPVDNDCNKFCVWVNVDVNDLFRLQSVVGSPYILIVSFPFELCWLFELGHMFSLKIT
ncbi:hypothetical protein Tco_0342978, partial [Tanacetum coccineum]